MVGVFNCNFLESTAALNLTQGSEYAVSSFSTIGTEYWSFLTENGSNPAMNAEVSRINICCFSNFNIPFLGSGEVYLLVFDKNFC